MSVNTSEKELTASNLTIDQLVYHLERSVQKICFNDTGLEGRYDFSLPLETIEQTQQVLMDSYGIKVEEEMRQVGILVLRFGDPAPER